MEDWGRILLAWEGSLAVFRFVMDPVLLWVRLAVEEIEEDGRWVKAACESNPETAVLNDRVIDFLEACFVVMLAGFARAVVVGTTRSKLCFFEASIKWWFAED